MSPEAGSQAQAFLLCSEGVGVPTRTTQRMLRQARDAPSGHSGPPIGAGSRCWVSAATSKMSSLPNSVHWPVTGLLSTCCPEPLEGRFCASAVSRDPFLPLKAIHPRVSSGVVKDQHEFFPTFWELVIMHQRGRQALLRVSPFTLHPNTAEWLPGTRTAGTKGQKQPPKGQA